MSISPSPPVLDALSTIVKMSVSGVTTAPVFAHYMVGQIAEAQAVVDVTQAKAMGFDAFALNVISMESWSINAITLLFKAALAIGFHLFFSFDMTHFSKASDMFPLLQQYVSHGAYFKQAGLPFVSTFYGGQLKINWDIDYKQALAVKGINTYFVPCFSDASTALSDPGGLYQQHPSVDGLFSWETAWPQISEGKVSVSNSADTKMSTSAKSFKKTFMMPISTLQFKHLSKEDNWVRRGELNLVERMAQILAQRPDFVEYLTWNDGGESTYIGNVYDSAIGKEVKSYIDNYDHKAWGTELIAPFISAYHSGATQISQMVPANNKKVSGAIWYRTILTTATCASDPLGKPRGWNNAEDVVNVAVILASPGATIKVYSADKLIASKVGVKGLNSWKVPGLQVGAVRVDVVASGATLTTTGGLKVAADAAVCNYNYQVVALK